MTRCFAYIRVSTVRQGQMGVSLEAQRDAIARYAARTGLEIVEWFEETQTAAKQGRPAFGRMLTKLRRRGAGGVVVHKIDRSARNLRDWADFAELADLDLEVHFASEALDLSSRGGRLSADIQAVVAADYIRNLREEARKGFYGRLRQGLLPVRAPVGYLDAGSGKLKEVDPERGPLVRELFERYATGRYSMRALTVKMQERGLRNHVGKPPNINGVSRILNNPFYKGLILIKTTGEVFEAAHEPLISSALFDRVQDVMHGRVGTVKAHRHTIALRRMVRCAGCGATLIPERQKGRVYYRCQQPSCPVRCTREDHIDRALVGALAEVSLSPEAYDIVKEAIVAATDEQAVFTAHSTEALRLRLDAVVARLGRLTDLLLDGAVEKDAHDEKRAALLGEKLRLTEEMAQAEQGRGFVRDRALRYLELMKTASLAYERANPAVKRMMVETMTSNLSADGKNVFVELQNPFRGLAEGLRVLEGEHSRDVPRTFESRGTPRTLHEPDPSVSSHEAMIFQLMEWCQSTPTDIGSVDISRPEEIELP